MANRRSIVIALAVSIGCHGHVADRGAPPIDATPSADGCRACVDARANVPDGSTGNIDGSVATVDAPVNTGDASVAPAAPVLYPLGRRHSPITASVAARLSAIGHRGTANVFAKVGDSITAMSSFATCFDHDYQLASHGALEPTRAYFGAGNAAGSSPYARTSLAATGGWQTSDELAGDPSPLDQEEDATTPLYGVVLLGTNDNRYGRSPIAYGHDLWTIVDDMIAKGTIPILSTIPPVNGDASTDARVPLFNLIVRAIAQGRQVPLVDLHDELVPLPSRGISSDGLHPTVSPSGACDLTDAGLQYGFNVRNLITLEALDRARAALAGSPSDTSAPTRSGSGTHTNPVIGALPLVDLADTHAGDASFTQYACDVTPRSGHEIVYKLTLTGAATLDAYLIVHGTTDASVHILAGSLATSACVASGTSTARASVGPGTVYIVVDSTTAATDGEYALIVNAE